MLKYSDIPSSTIMLLIKDTFIRVSFQMYNLNLTNENKIQSPFEKVFSDNGPCHFL
jgi:hypothetical protein